MDAEPSTAGVRILHGRGVLERAGIEAAALGSRALLVSAGRPDRREAGLLDRLRRELQAARVGHHPFARVPRLGEPTEPARSMASEAAREGRCRLVIGLGDGPTLEVSRFAAASAWLPSLLIPTVVGYGPPMASDELPLPDVLLIDPGAMVGSPPPVTARQGAALLTGLVEAYAAGPLPGDPLERVMRTLVDELPGAVRSPDAEAPRASLAEALAGTAETMASRGAVPQPIAALASRFSGIERDPEGVYASLLPAVLEVSASSGAPLAAGPVAAFGRSVLDVKEDDDGRAALWTAGGIRQWMRNLGLDTRVAGRAPAAREDDDGTWREILAAMRR